VSRIDIPLFIFPTFMKSGEQTFVVKYQKPLEKEARLYPATTIVKFRDESIPKFVKSKAKK
jgi:hypothetical protein